jgi:hypothetical protein
MADPFTLIFKMLEPNLERQRWTEVQTAWRAVASAQEIDLVEDGAEDTWPVTRRVLGDLPPHRLVIGIVTHRETYLETNDPTPLEGLTCDIAPASLLSSFAISRVETHDKAFDAELTTRANDEELARRLLSEDLRSSLRRAPAPFHFRYDGGRARLTWTATALERQHLGAALAVVLTACMHAGSSIYR